MRSLQSNPHALKIEIMIGELNFLVLQENIISDKIHQIHETVSKNLVMKY